MQRRPRGGLKGKPREKALLRSNILKVEQTNSARRLQKDLKELEDSPIPLVGVSARPLSNSLYIWHGNLRGPEGTPFEGGVFHFELTFPQNYPVQPPTIKAFTNIPHPNVFGQTICLDILDGKNKQIYQGWTSAYTVETVLIQLQSFLFEELPVDILKGAQIANKQAIKTANDFKCTNPDCNHQGPIKPYPPFSQKEKDHEAFIMLKSPEELLAEELICFHTKGKIKDHTLGIGVSLARLPRTGEIRMITPTLDLLSLRAYIKHKVRYSLSNEKFSHWLPLYFGEKDIFEVKRMVLDKVSGKKEQQTIKINAQERCIHLLKKAITYLCAGSTRKPFKPTMILEVMPKIIVTHVVDMIQDYKHVSILALRRLFNFIRLARLLFELYPETEQLMDQRIEEFIKQPEKRHKDYCQNLGDLLAFTTLSQKYKIEDVLNAYLEEQIDRQAFWILREIPELDHEDPKYKDKEVLVEEQRAEVCFKTGLAGFHITLFFFFLNKMIIEQGGVNYKQLCEQLDARCGCLKDEQEVLFQKKCQEVQEVKSFLKYYPMLGVPMPDDAALRERLKQAISNSRKKNYHGNYGQVNELPKLEDQAAELLKEKVDPFAYYDEKKNEFLDAKDPRWEKACLDKFSWINSIHLLRPADSKPKPKDYAQMSDDQKINPNIELNIKREKDQLLNELSSRNETDQVLGFYKTTSMQDYTETFSWRDLFLKLCFEQMIEYFPQIQDFKVFYKYINSMQSHIKCLRIPILDKKSFKSNHYWLMTLIGRMTGLEIMKIHKSSIVPFGVDGFKFMQKGFKYFQDNSGKLLKIQINNILYASDEYLYQCLKCVPDLRVLKVSDCTLSVKEAQTIGKVLSDFKFIQEVDLTSAGLNASSSKEIADGLMRAKQIQTLICKNNAAMGAGATSILYNLAFSPKIAHIDFTNVPLNNKDAAEALYKLVKISGSLETLILKSTSIVNNLTEDFFIALGENKTLTFLNLDNTRANSNIVNLLGKACGMNHRKNGNFKYLSIENTLGSAAEMASFFNAFQISDYAHEMWYGDKKIAKEMQKEQLETKFEFGLEYINFGKSSIGSNGFRLKEFQKLVNPRWPAILEAVASKSLNILNFTQCSIVKQDMELISTCLFENPLGDTTKLRILNLSRNKIMKEGAKTLAPALAGNKTLEVLDLSQCWLGVSGTQAIAEALMKNSSLKTLNLYRNRVDVDGARALRELLKCNSSLEFLDVGYNRLRQKGIMAITDGICENKNSKITHLGIRFNFIRDEGFAYLFDNAIFKGKSKIQYLYSIQNYLSEHYSIELYNKIVDIKKQLYVDSFEKIQFLNQERMDRSIWISPAPPSCLLFPEKLIKFFQQDYECGLIQDVRVRRGQKIQGKPKENSYAIIEYRHQNSVPRSLRVASKKWSNIDRVNFRIYKAGTRTIVFFKSGKRRQ